MSRLKWYECEVSDDGDVKMTLFKFQKEMRRAFRATGWPEGAVVFGETGIGDSSDKVWITSSAAQAAEANGFQWQKYYVKDLPEAPLKEEAAILVGYESAWNLLRENKKEQSI